MPRWLEQRRQAGRLSRTRAAMLVLGDHRFFYGPRFLQTLLGNIAGGTALVAALS
jgi:hypothetical protein